MKPTKCSPPHLLGDPEGPLECTAPFLKRRRCSSYFASGSCAKFEAADATGKLRDETISVMLALAEISEPVSAQAKLSCGSSLHRPQGTKRADNSAMLKVPVTKPKRSARANRPVAARPVATPSRSVRASRPVAVEPRLAHDDLQIPAKLMRLDLENFMVFEKQSFSLEGGALSCVVGPNSSGKTSLVRAIQFVCLCGEPTVHARHLVRFAEPPCNVAVVTASFAGPEGRIHMLRREARQDASPARFWVATQGRKAKKASFQELSAEDYKAFLMQDLLWEGEVLVISQFALWKGSAAGRLVDSLPQVLLDAANTREATSFASGPPPQPVTCKAPSDVAAVASTSRGNGHLQCIASESAEAWLARRLDDIYRELSRVPLDDRMETWGEGGEAVLQRLEGGGYSIFLSRRRGVASAGHGTPLESLSDGEKDLCAIALLIALHELRANSGSVPVSFALFDEPDSRLDRRHTKALRLFLEGLLGPRQSVLLSLNNHQALSCSGGGSICKLDAPNASGA